MAYTDIQKVRIEVADSEPGLYILEDDEIQYLLDKRSGSIVNASLDAARIILMKLSQRSDESVDVFSIKGSKVAENYKAALELYLKDPNLNPLINNLGGYFGGVSLSDMEANNSNPDNHLIDKPAENHELYLTGPFNVGWRF